MLDKNITLPPRSWSDWEPWARARMVEGLSTAQLRRWLAGDEVPLDDQRTRPSDWILEALPRGEARQRPLGGLVAAMTTLMRFEGPSLSNQELDSLFDLAAGIAQPSTLADPLGVLLDSVDLRDREWDELPLSVSARYALQWNQPDDRWLESLWLPMIRGAEVRWAIQGDAFDGFDGAMWTGTASNAEPLALGRILLEIAEALRGTPTARDDFKAVLVRACRINPVVTREDLYRGLQILNAEEWMLEDWIEEITPCLEQYSGWDVERCRVHVTNRILEIPKQRLGGSGYGVLKGAVLHAVPKAAGAVPTQEEICREFCTS